MPDPEEDSKMSEQNKKKTHLSLGEALPKEMARVRDEVMPAYLACGPVAGIALSFMRQELDRAAKALAEGNVAEMIDTYKSLQEYEC